jgi:hypothetical protein
MGDIRIRIDLSQGIMEAEGNEQFVLRIYSDFIEKIKGRLKSPSGSKKIKARKADEKPQNDNKIKKKSASKRVVLYKLVKSVDLSGAGEMQSLNEFFQQYKASKFYEYNLIFCYYLQEVAGITPITIDHVFTCYRHISKLRTPKALSQSLFDTSRRQGWIDTSSLDNITVSLDGINHIEHAMERK